MHFSLLTLALTALSIPAVTANFDVYRVYMKRPYAQGGDKIIWQQFSSPPDCPTALGPDGGVYGFPDLRDVSKKPGFRCEGSGCAQQKPAGDIDILEMHIQDNPKLHWSELSCTRAVVGCLVADVFLFSSDLQGPWVQDVWL